MRLAVADDHERQAKCCLKIDGIVDDDVLGAGGPCCTMACGGDAGNLGELLHKSNGGRAASKVLQINNGTSLARTFSTRATIIRLHPLP